MEQAQNLDIVQKPTATVHVVGEYTLAQRKLANICFACGQQDDYANIHKDHYQDHAYTLPVSVVSKFMSHKRIKNHDWLKDILTALTTKDWQYNTFSVDQESWGVFTLLAGGEVNNGHMYFTFNPVFLKKMQGCRLGTNFSLQVQSGFTRKQSLPLYEFGKDLLSRNHSEAEDGTLSIQELQQFLGVTSSYSILKRDVLKPVHAELNQKSDLTFSYKGLHEEGGNKVTSVKLSFSVKKEAGSADALIEPELLLQSALDASSLVSTHQAVAPSPGSDSSSLQRQLEAMGVEAGQAQKLVTEFDHTRILDNIAYVKDQASKAQKPLNSYGGYMVKAIRQNYAPQKSDRERQQELSSQWEQYRRSRAEHYFLQLPTSEQEAYRQHFLSWVEQSNKLAWQRYQYEGGWEDGVVKKVFFEYTLRKLLKMPEETDFEAFCCWHKMQRVA